MLKSAYSPQQDDRQLNNNHIMGYGVTMHLAVTRGPTCASELPAIVGVTLTVRSTARRESGQDSG